MKLRTQIERKTAGKSRNEQTGAKNHRDAVLSCPKRMTAFRALGKIIRDLRFALRASIIFHREHPFLFDVDQL